LHRKQDEQNTEFYSIYSTVLGIFSLLFTCAHVDTPDQEVSCARLYDIKWQEYINEITNIDSLICDRIEENMTVQMYKNSFTFFTAGQQERITTFTKYCNARIELYSDSTEFPVEHKRRFTFLLYDKYFNRLGSGDLALEVEVSESRYTGKKYLYLLKKNAPRIYSIAYSLGESPL